MRMTEILNLFKPQNVHMSAGVCKYGFVISDYVVGMFSDLSDKVCFVLPI